MVLVGTPSDDVEAVLATGHTDVTTVFVSMSARHPDGDDAEYLEWHTLDHRPEQSRLATVRGSVRLVSTPACRAARAACDERYEAVDHVMTYFFTDLAEVPGVAGARWAATVASAPLFSTAEMGRQITYCFLDDDPVDAAPQLQPALEQRWSSGEVRPLFAAPFHTVVPHAWDRHIP
jgi:hypothetical protein